MGRRVISEREVRRVARAARTSGGSATLDAAGAAVTPAALDTARKLGVTLTGLAGGDRFARQSGKPNDHGPPGDAARAATAPAPAVAGPAASAGGQTLLRLSIGADHGGVALKGAVVAFLREQGHSVDDRGTHTADPVDYPDIAVAVARDVAGGVANFGIVIDGAGIGSCMAANKIAGVRAALCYDVSSARNAREHNSANVLTLGAGMVGTRLALDITQTFLTTPFGGGRHAARVAKIDALDATASATSGVKK